MKNFFLFLLAIVLFGEGVTLFLLHRPKTQEKVFPEATVLVTPSLTPTPTETPTPTPTPTKTPLATPKPTAKAGTPVPAPTVTSEQINGFINRFAGQYGVDPNVIRHIALCESGFNPAAVNGPYAGLFQFAPTTWKNLRAKMGEDTNINLRLNAEEAVQTASYAVSIGNRSIWPHCNP